MGHWAYTLRTVSLIVYAVVFQRNARDLLFRMDCIKQYMNHRGVPEMLQRRVKKWLDYSWTRFVQRAGENIRMVESRFSL